LIQGNPPFPLFASLFSNSHASGRSAKAIIDKYPEYIVIYFSVDDAEDGATSQGADFIPILAR